MKAIMRTVLSSPRQHRGASSCLSLCAAIVAVAVSACGTTSDPAGGAGSGAAGSSVADSGGMPEAAAPEDVGTMHPTATTCTKPHSICVDIKMPDTVDSTPVRLDFDIYDSPGAPAHPPNGYAGIFHSPTVTAGQTVHFELTDAEQQGDFWLFAVMYMPGGGYGAPVVGTDYLMRSPPAVLHLDGTPLNLDPITIGK
jgi:hypothetical protein